MKKQGIILIIALVMILSGFNPHVEEDTIKVPTGFKVGIFAEGLGTARHIAFTPQGNAYIKLAKLVDGKGIVMLQDADKDGKAEKKSMFGDFTGTGMVVKGNYLYASSDQEIFRYTLDANGVVTNRDSPEKLVTGLINRRQHAAKAIALDNKGNLYVNIGAFSNACQEVDRTKGSKGMMPCPILDSAGGIWQFSAAKMNQTYGTGKRYATGLRNIVGLDWNTENDQLFVMQHGRDMLFQLYPEYFDAKQSAELPAECMYALKQGDDAGWPYIYYDQNQKKKILAPEFGGDGKKTGGEKAIDPVVAFPGHLAPNGLLFYKGKMFPTKYKNGAFIAFHGSWNRAPEKQQGYFVAFVPFKGGKPSGPYEVFADNFSELTSIDAPGQAVHRPCGLAEGPDGALYVTDDVKGTVYKITYGGK
ncbi:MAG: PQQ-dependent sugar dehydrogenase [Chryseolinea sp.]